LDYKELDVLQKFCYNKVDYYYFKKIMVNISTNEYYLEEAFFEFRKNEIKFLMDGHREQFELIVSRIGTIGYEG
jgi:hypothetical protein